MVDSPSPAAANTYAAWQREEAERARSLRSSALPTVIGEPERFTSTVAPASAAIAEGGTGTHMSSQISTNSFRPGTSSTVMMPCGVSACSSPPMRTVSPAASSPGAYQRRS